MNPDAAVHWAGSAFFEHGILPRMLTVLWGGVAVYVHGSHHFV